MIYLFYFLIIIFLYLNIKIIASDLKIKRIPNKYLGYLLLLIPLWWFFLFLKPISGLNIYYNEINILLFLGQIILTLIVGFLLYYFGIWAAGDAKYLLVLSLFIPHIGVIPFIGNIGFITIIYLFLYFIYFYLIKILFNKNYRLYLLSNIKEDLGDKWNIYINNNEGNISYIIGKYILIFLLIFTSIRLLRIYIFNSLIEVNMSKYNLLLNILQLYNIYFAILLILIFILFIYVIKIYINKIKNYIYKNKLIKISNKYLSNIFFIITFISLITFISFEYYKNPYEIKSYLTKIFTIYLFLYLIIKILKYSYKITFGIAEYKFINIKDLKKGDIIDKKSLVKTFGKQSALGFATTKRKQKQRKKFLLFPYPKIHLLNIKNPIDEDNLELLKKIFFITNKYNKKHIHNYKTITTIKIINTFPFGIYIFIGFILTFILQDKIFKNIFLLIIQISKILFK